MKCRWESGEKKDERFAGEPVTELHGTRTWLAPEDGGDQSVTLGQSAMGSDDTLQSKGTAVRIPLFTCSSRTYYDMSPRLFSS